MNTCIADFAALAPRGAELLTAIKETGITKHALAVELQVSLSTASLLIAVAAIFDAEELAAATGLSIEKMRAISRTELTLCADVDRRQVRLQLIDEAHAQTVDELKAHVAAVIEKLNEGRERRRKWHLRYGAEPDADGMGYLLAKLPAEQIETLRNSLTPQARGYVQAGEAVDEAEGHAKALYNRVMNGLQGHEHVEDWEDPENPLDVRQRPCIVIPDWELETRVDGTVVDTNGSIIKIEDIANRRVAKYGFAVMVHKDHRGIMRPQRALPIKRLADAEQRFLAITGHLICQHPDCNVRAVRCEIHHIVSFAAGGPTENDNLCPLCRTHNLLNDDNPENVKNGHVFTDPETGQTWYKAPDGTVRRNWHAINDRGLVAYGLRLTEENIRARRPNWVIEAMKALE